MMLEWLSPHASVMERFHEDILSKRFAQVGEAFLSDFTTCNWMDNNSNSQAILLGIGDGK
jgi:hypothetical protein